MGHPCMGVGLRCEKNTFLTGVRYLISYEEKPQRLSYYKIRDKKFSLQFV